MNIQKSGNRQTVISGQPYLWCYLGNFGGNSFLSGPVNLVSERLADALKRMAAVILKE
ncbi:hypothetical protein NXX23_20760 [Bacteroides ovatus]|nr:hypothetical protein [Bacteroides ovatus]